MVICGEFLEHTLSNWTVNCSEFLQQTLSYFDGRLPCENWTMICGEFLPQTLSNCDGELRVDFYNTFLVISMVYCGVFFIKVLGQRKLDNDILNMILNYYILMESYGESFTYIYIVPNNFIITSKGT